MVHLTHTLGFPRIGVKRELKQALESYWAGKISQQQLLETGRSLRQRHWQWQQDAGVDLLPVGDFAWYDQVLGTSLLLGNIPARHQSADGRVDLDTLFRIARGRAPSGHSAAASEMRSGSIPTITIWCRSSARSRSSPWPGASSSRRSPKLRRWAIESNPFFSAP